MQEKDNKILFKIKIHKDHFLIFLKNTSGSWACGLSWEVGKGAKKNQNLLCAGLSF